MNHKKSIYKGLILLLLFALSLSFLGCDLLDDLNIGDIIEKPMRTITIDIVGNGSVDPSSGQKIEDGKALILTVMPAENHEFQRWGGVHGSEVFPVGGKENEYRIIMNGDKYITAFFVATGVYYSLEVEIDPAGAGTVARNVDPGERGYREGTAVRLTANPNTNYRFSHWSGDLTGSTNPSNITMNENKNVRAHFVETEEGAEVGAVMGKVTDSQNNPLEGVLVEAGGEEQTTGADGGYILNNISAGQHRISASKEGYFPFSGNVRVEKGRTLTQNITLIAEGVEEHYTLTVDTSGEGTGVVEKNPKPGPDGYLSGTRVTLFAYPNPGSYFSHWEDGFTGTRNPAAITMNKDTRVVAVFEESIGVGTVEGYVADINWEPIEGAKVQGGGQETTTDEDGLFFFEDISIGFQIFTVSKEGYISATQVIDVEADMVNILDFTLFPEGEGEELDLAIQLIYDLNDSFIQFRDTVEHEMTYVGEKVESDVAPYMGGVGSRMGFIADILEECFEDLDDPTLGNWTAGTQFWTWEKEISGHGGTHQITITITNFQDIFSYDEEENTYYLDFTSAYFNYEHTHTADKDFHWSFNFQLDPWTTDVGDFVFVDWDYDYETGDYVEETIIITLPLSGEAALEGYLTDNLDFEGVSDIGEIFINAWLQYELFDEEYNYLSFFGSFDSKIFSASGNFYVEFSRFHETYDWGEETILIPHYIYFYGSVDLRDKDQTLFLSAFASFDVFFIIDEPLLLEEDLMLPLYVNVYGSLDVFRDGIYTMGLNGSLSFNFDYDQGGMAIFFNGNFERPGFHPYHLWIDVYLYDYIYCNFWYLFGVNKELAGTLSLEEDGIILEAYGSHDIGIEVKYNPFYYYGDGDVIGIVYSINEGTLLGEIMIIDGHPVVIFPNGVIIAFLI